MQVIKNKKLTEDNWQFVVEPVLPSEGDICVDFANWQDNKSALLSHTGKVGVKIGPADNMGDLVDDLPHLQLVALDFPDFADGRLFSKAWLLRSRYGFNGEIRATGHFMPDQVFYLSRVGVDAFQPAESSALPRVLENLHDFSVVYQPSVVN